MTACLAYPGIYTLNNVPVLRDTTTMVKLLKIIGCKTVREKNGLAYSSRNNLLSYKEKIIASKIFKLLKNKKHNLIKDKKKVKDNKKRNS